MVYLAGLILCQSSKDEKLARTCLPTIKVMYVYLCEIPPLSGNLVH